MRSVVVIHSNLCHGLVPWCLTLAANRTAIFEQDATGSSRGDLRFVARLISNRRDSLTINVKFHGASPWHPKNFLASVVAAFVITTGHARGIRLRRYSK